MRLLYAVLILAIVVGAYFVVRYITERNAQEQLDRVEKWRTLPVEDRLSAHTDFTAEFIRRDAVRTTWAITFCLVMFSLVILFSAFIQDLNGAQNRQVDRNTREIARACTVDARFRDLLDSGLENDIRVKQEQRDRLADSLSSAAADPSAAGGFDAMPTSVRHWVTNYINLFLANQRTTLTQLDADLGALRAQKTAVREFNAGQDCPNG